MESPFTPVLYTNYAPTEQELGIISHLIVAPEQELQHLDTAIDHLEAHLEQLSKRRDDVWAAVSAHRALTGWIRRVPDEILQEIFVTTLPYSYLPTMSSKSTPVLLTHVCRRWRQLALSNPRLWAGLHVNKRENKDSIADWLSRAGSVPITLSFDSAYGIKRVLDSLPNSTQTRWNGFQMLLDGYGTESNIHTLFKPFLDRPLLPSALEDTDNSPIQRSRRLYLEISQTAPKYHSRSTVAEDRQKRIVKILTEFRLESNPHLRSLTLHHNHGLDSLDITPFIPCANLEYLQLGSHSLSIPSVITLLQQCPRLVVFQAPLDRCDNHPVEEATPSDHRIIHRGIQQLAFSAWFTPAALQTIATTFHHDAFPSLSLMHLNFSSIISHSLDSLDLPKVLSALDTSLTSLTISPTYLTQAQMMQFLAGLPSLVQLHLLEVSGKVKCDSLYDAEIIWFLSPRQPGDRDEDVHGGSRLQYLKLGLNSSTFDDEALPGLLFGREVPLQQAHIHFRWPEYEMEHGVEFEDFAELVEAGLDLQLRYGEPYREPRNQPRKARDFPQVDRLVYGWEDF